MPSSYNLCKHLKKFAVGQIANDRYSSASEGIRADLRLLNDQERERNARPEALRAEIQVGLGDWENCRTGDGAIARTCIGLTEAARNDADIGLSTISDLL
ncbi:MAG: type II toxin-antitoxin system ParD family antitoxin [Alphaproteobacteria bacterium]|jgi:antitoxin ParD1/3/4|nr:type II toxin-antitoxin system ParD family antitoxin [Alphaproteobacteria bacterium]|tara:strand:- start:602 stop:901 length:300 start_codon:yes stop_codon:yes gene_type:complete